jgi:F420H(2)-dependent quinone reductase
MGAFEKAGEAFVRTKFGSWFFIHVANRIDRVLLPLTRGRFSFSGRKMTVGLLTTTGAKSGQERKTPLVYLPDGERIVLVASKGGAPKHPAWYHNLTANPDVRFLGKRGERRYTAREAEGEERDHLWAEVNDLYAGYETYQGRANERRIPIIVLEPKG